MIINLNITEKDIIDGETYSSTACPVSLALRRRDDIINMCVDSYNIRVWMTNNKCYVAETGRALGTWLDNFDKTGTGYPAQFRLHFKRESYRFSDKWNT